MLMPSNDPCPTVFAVRENLRRHSINCTLPETYSRQPAMAQHFPFGAERAPGIIRVARDEGAGYETLANDWSICCPPLLLWVRPGNPIRANDVGQLDC